MPGPGRRAAATTRTGAGSDHSKICADDLACGKAEIIEPRMAVPGHIFSWCRYLRRARSILLSGSLTFGPGIELNTPYAQLSAVAAAIQQQEGTKAGVITMSKTNFQGCRMAKFCISVFLLINAATAWSRPYPIGKSVQICGTLVRETEPGPPDFSPSDAQHAWSAWLLVFDKQVEVVTNTGTDESGSTKLSRIQVETSDLEHTNGLAAFEGRLVTVSGKLWTASAQGDVTRVVIASFRVRNVDRCVR